MAHSSPSLRDKHAVCDGWSGNAATISTATVCFWITENLASVRSPSPIPSSADTSVGLFFPWIQVWKRRSSTRKGCADAQSAVRASSQDRVAPNTAPTVLPKYTENRRPHTPAESGRKWTNKGRKSLYFPPYFQPKQGRLTVSPCTLKIQIQIVYISPLKGVLI